jgi:Protein of unknown function (DUF2867)
MNPDPAIVSIAIPAESRVRQIYARTHLADAYELRLPEGATDDAEALARFIFSSQPAWVSWLMRLRDLIVGRLGLKTADGLRTATGKRIGIFKVYETHRTEVVLGEDDRHLDFRVSVLARSRPDAAHGATFVVVSTVVHCHNRFGRCYIFLIAPFHRQVVKAGLRRAAGIGWPAPAGVPRAVTLAADT